MEALGRHILVEFLVCDPDVLNDVPKIENAMVDAATKASATVISSDFHHFSPWGVSGVVIIQESHFAIHTWPEYQYAAVDLFTCGDEVDPWLAFDNLKEALSSKTYSVLEMHRGPINLLKRIPYNAEGYRPIAFERQQELESKRSIWFTDKDENIALSLRSSGKLLFDKTSDYQRTRVFDSYGFGKVLTIDNMVMCTERDEANYHEMIAHPAMFAHGNVEKALIIGGGDGGTAREILRHHHVTEIDMVEIDGNVIEASKAHLPTMSCSFDDPRLNLRIEDGIAFVKNAPDESYDLVVIDGSDPVGPAQGLFSVEFYKNCRRVLKEGGVLVTQGESPMFNQQVFVALSHTLKNIFGTERVHTMLFQIASYPTGIWSFHIATKDDIDVKRTAGEGAAEFALQHQLKYFNAEMHRAAFMLPGYVKEMLAAE